MAPSAIDGDASSASKILDQVTKPPPGVVLPPKDIRAIVEKTAGYVARNGVVFEERIKEKEKNNSKFCFLSQNDAYNPYYAWRLNEVREGRGTAISAGRVGEAATSVEPAKPQGPKLPAEFHFSARMPNISAQDLDVVRLTALFVAKNGRSFMMALSQKESRNPQFDFLRPQQTLHQFFSRLVDQYTELMQAPTVDGGRVQRARIAELEMNAHDRFHILGRAKQRAEWVKFQDQERQKKEDEQEKEKLEYAQIDWHDFVVVETVLFNEGDDQADLPAPASLNDLQSASLEQKAAMSLQPTHMRIEEAMPTEDFYNSYAQQEQQFFAPPPSMPGYPPFGQVPQPSLAEYAQAAPSVPLQDDDELRAIQERAEARERAQAAQAAAKGGPGQPMRIRNDYVPRAQAKRQNAAMALCPNCKQQVPLAELDQHMKIELLDPQWKAQRQKAEARQATTNLSTSDVAANLKRLASQRSDVFDGVTGQPVISEEEMARRKRVALTSYAGDGGSDKAAQAARGVREAINIEEQIRQIHQKAKG